MYIKYIMETSFQQIVLGIAIVFLIIILVFIGYSLGNSKSKGQWPPKIANCPDYWELDPKSDETKTICNQKEATKIGTCLTKTFTATETPCDKYKWAIGCGAQWDGVTYGYGKYRPCDTKPPTK
jgi:hypothetical protein